MTQDDVIRLSKEAGLELRGHGWIADDNGYPSLVAFAKLVAAHEREKIAEWYSKDGWLLDEDDVASAIRARGQA